MNLLKELIRIIRIATKANKETLVNRRTEIERKPDEALNFRMQWRLDDGYYIEIPEAYYERRPLTGNSS